MSDNIYYYSVNYQGIKVFLKTNVKLLNLQFIKNNLNQIKSFT